MWPFNPKAMDNKTEPSQIYTTQPVNDQGNEDNTTNDEVDQKARLGEKNCIYKSFAYK